MMLKSVKVVLVGIVLLVISNCKTVSYIDDNSNMDNEIINSRRLLVIEELDIINDRIINDDYYNEIVRD